MKSQKFHCALNEDLALSPPAGDSLTVKATDLALINLGEQVSECRLTFQVSPQIYQHIDQEALFNLKPEMRGQIFADGFLPEIDIEIEAKLQSALLPILLSSTEDVSEVAAYLLNLSQQQPSHPLFKTENWLGLYVKQERNGVKTGYRTKWADADFPSATDAEVISMGAIYEEMLDFFTKEDWLFSKVEKESALVLNTDGKNGEFTCLAIAKEELAQFVFYSVCPEKAPVEKRVAVAEFLSRVNYGWIIGNFEMDFNDGEIRFKTSIDVEGSILTPALLKQLVYTNVLMMDKYLPGIKAVIYGDLSPAEAIAQIESQLE